MLSEKPYILTINAIAFMNSADNKFIMPLYTMLIYVHCMKSLQLILKHIYDLQKFIQ